MEVGDLHLCALWLGSYSLQSRSANHAGFSSGNGPWALENSSYLFSRRPDRISSVLRHRLKVLSGWSVRGRVCPAPGTFADCHLELEGDEDFFRVDIRVSGSG